MFFVPRKRGPTKNRRHPANELFGGSFQRQPGRRASGRRVQRACKPHKIGEAMMRRRVYISGPLTSSGNVNENLDRAMHAARALIEAGFAPFCPHLTIHVDPVGEYPHATWMEIELPWVSVADALLRLPGESLGADLEVTRAEEAGIPVFATVAEVAGHFATVAPGSERRYNDRSRSGLTIPSRLLTTTQT